MMTVRVLILDTSFTESIDVTELTPEDTVGRVKAVVEGRCRRRTPAAWQQLLHGGKELDNDSATLREACGASAGGAVVEMHMQQREVSVSVSDGPSISSTTVAAAAGAGDASSGGETVEAWAARALVGKLGWPRGSADKVVAAFEEYMYFVASTVADAEDADIFSIPRVFAHLLLCRSSMYPGCCLHRHQTSLS